MLKIAICDDDVQQLESTYDRVLSFTHSKPDTDFSVRRFQSAYDLLECIEMTSGFQIYLLDILMPVMNGIDVGARIREKDDNAILIYLTSSPDYAVKSYGVSAFHYLLKPLEFDELNKTLEKALVKLDLESAKILPIKTKDGITALRFHQIQFAEYIDHCISFHLSNGAVVTNLMSREPFDTIANEFLKDRRFVRPHISFVVNMSFARTIAGKDFLMTDGSLVAISQKKLAEVKKRYIDFLLKGDIGKC